MKWYEQHPGRLIKETEIMKASYPQARLAKISGGTLAWVVRLETNTNRKYLVTIEYPDGFPVSYPRAFVVEPRIENAPHRYINGALCLFNATDRSERSYVPDKTTAVTITTWAAAWLASYEIWRQTGQWPERRVR